MTKYSKLAKAPAGSSQRVRAELVRLWSDWSVQLRRKFCMKAEAEETLSDEEVISELYGESSASFSPPGPSSRAWYSEDWRRGQISL